MTQAIRYQLMYTSIYHALNDMGIYLLREKRKKTKHLNLTLKLFLKMKKNLNLIKQFENSIVQKKSD
jgi:hypothetical protein